MPIITKGQNDLRLFVLAIYRINLFDNRMKAYKLFKVRKNGSIGSLFINAARVLPVGEWLEAEFKPRKGFAPRKGFHVLASPSAPHLQMELASGQKRKWFVVEIEDYEEIKRPESQGGLWYLANRLKILHEL